MSLKFLLYTVYLLKPTFFTHGIKKQIKKSFVKVKQQTSIFRKNQFTMFSVSISLNLYDLELLNIFLLKINKLFITFYSNVIS